MGADRPSYLLALLRGLWRGHFGLTIRVATAVAGLSTLAACLGGKLGILRKATLLVRDTLAALTACDSGELPILRKTPLGARDALTAFAAGLSGQSPVLRKTTLLVRNGLTAHAGDLPLTLLIH